MVYEDECVIFPVACGDHAQCVNTEGSYYCSCHEGFKMSLTGLCIDIDECSDPDVCGTNGDCYNHQGGYSCRCNQGYSNYGNNQSKCIEMDCDQFGPLSVEHRPKKLKHLMSLLKKSCESLNDPRGEHFTGEELLRNVFNSTDELLSEGNIADGETLNQFLDVVENSMRLIGPQLKEPVTRMETHNTFAEVAVMRGQTPPSGRCHLSTTHALFSTTGHIVGNDVCRFCVCGSVVTAVVSNAETKQLSEPVTLVFTHEEERAESEGMAYSCVYWNESEGAWSGRGCEKAESNSTHTVCSCSHLSSFAVLMALYPVQDSFDLVLITRVGLVLSLVCLFLCILTFKFCRSIQGTRTSIHLHLSICLFIADLVFLCGISSTQNKVCVLYLLYMGALKSKR
ncbi:hypothetical protein cypCar_00049248 [Cyprinus carpio]|nr:hypothetical protein cypCar_00049248 [Cyprinus carpio]